MCYHQTRDLLLPAVTRQKLQISFYSPRQQARHKLCFKWFVEFSNLITSCHTSSFFYFLTSKSFMCVPYAEDDTVGSYSLQHERIYLLPYIRNGLFFQYCAWYLTSVYMLLNVSKTLLLALFFSKYFLQDESYLTW